MRAVTCLLGLCLLTVMAGASAAQSPTTDRLPGPPNLPAPVVLPKAEVRLQVDWRPWEGRPALAGAVDWGLSRSLQVGVSYAGFDNRGDPPIAGAPRESHLHGPGLKCTWQAKRFGTGRWAAGVAPGLELLHMKGRNAVTGLTADTGTRGVFTFEAPVALLDGGKPDAFFLLVPKLATFPSSAPVVGLPGKRIAHFGTVVGLGIGVVAPVDHRERWWLMADVTPILSGKNVVRKATGTLGQAPLWSVGLRWRAKFINEASHLDAFATTAAGPTAATSLIAAPDQTVTFGTRLSVRF